MDSGIQVSNESEIMHVEEIKWEIVHEIKEDVKVQHPYGEYAVVWMITQGFLPAYHSPIIQNWVYLKEIFAGKIKTIPAAKVVW